MPTKTAIRARVTGVAGQYAGGSAALSRNTANGANPIPVIVPSHGGLGAYGDLIGHGGGLDSKRVLLRLEGALPTGLDLAERGVGAGDAPRRTGRSAFVV